ncbi:MAG: hypothetical protein LUD69_02865, partial [Oscillospiraceae bacterium]|nr:hypothetical protein [Oscillospiraceae bacterium]
SILPSSICEPYYRKEPDYATVTGAHIGAPLQKRAANSFFVSSFFYPSPLVALVVFLLLIVRSNFPLFAFSLDLRTFFQSFRRGAPMCAPAWEKQESSFKYV